uniref:AlNc14C19G1938 protein n=1 Tax=Albugo laibachii Nc14 TaxID=890382 RepID=F0W4W7_9STRA|nr:AlNc14C19G1938 [Albugo laibachii Nc14]|eukprot:CCA16156.1 AlNc14C19G1938 [Albugo laibachii Nc14]
MQICISLRYLFTLAWIRRCKTCHHRGAKCTCVTRHTNVLEYIFYLESRKTASRSIRLDSMQNTDRTRDRSSTGSSTIQTDRTEGKRRTRANTHISSGKRYNPTFKPQRKSSHRSHEAKSGKQDKLDSNGSHSNKPALVLFHQDSSKKCEARLLSNQHHEGIYELEDFDFNPNVTMALKQDLAGAPKMYGSRQNWMREMDSLDAKRASCRSSQQKMLTHSQLDSSLAASAGTGALPSPTDLAGSRAWAIGISSQLQGDSRGDSTALRQLRGWLSQSPTNSSTSSFLYTYNV